MEKPQMLTFTWQSFEWFLKKQFLGRHTQSKEEVRLYYTVMRSSANSVEKSSIKLKRKIKFWNNISFFTKKALWI